MRCTRSSWAAVGLCLVLCGFTLGGWDGVALAHERVELTAEHSAPSHGPLLADGTIARAAFANLTAIGQTRGLRLRLRGGQDLRMELLIPDTAPANRLPSSSLPEVTVVAPDRTRTTVAITERTPFFEPYSGRSYLYLARLSAKAQTGVYQVLVTSRSNVPVTAVLGIGYREVFDHRSD